MAANNRVGLTPGIASITGPGIITGMRNHPGPDRVHFNIPVTGQQMFFSLDQAGLVPVFP